ncbi:VOC family protein [Sphingosinicella sp. LHD-64]|uniref:VOC family protein n=1 Tax=Sphingosinicella sp. LHD-64 TaxID=3072139 RepID=UPI00280CA3EA|nr:VOC family protein [Sphingosinicella sp. LHD-64]MDQ8756831.1 VOC family protein [Sphingosinicella sp. LHD-64]
MTNSHGSFVWYELMTTDPEGARRFYGDVVGWSFGDPVPGDVEYRMIDAPDGAAGGMLTLTQAMCDGGARPVWLGYLGVDDVDAAVAKAVTAGAKVQMAPFDAPGVGRIAMILDPQGVPIYLIRGASDADSTAYQRRGMGHVAWNELMTSDREAALAFYRDHFDYAKEGAMDMGPELGEYSFIAHDGETVGAVMKASSEAPTVWQFYVRVPDVDAAADRIKAGGGQVLFGPMDVPTKERVLIGLDPQGASFGLVSGGDK